MSGNPEWTFYRDDKSSEAEVMPRLIAEFPGFRPRWEKHLELWKGKPAGSYNDIAEFAHFVVDDLYPNGNTADLQRAFDLMEHWLVNGNQNLRNLVATGFLESVQNIASWQEFGKEAFVGFLGPQSRKAWSEIERLWAGKTSLVEIVRPNSRSQTVVEKSLSNNVGGVKQVFERTSVSTIAFITSVTPRRTCSC